MKWFQEDFLALLGLLREGLSTRSWPSDCRSPMRAARIELLEGVRFHRETRARAIKRTSSGASVTSRPSRGRTLAQTVTDGEQRLLVARARFAVVVEVGAPAALNLPAALPTGVRPAPPQDACRPYSPRRVCAATLVAQ